MKERSGPQRAAGGGAKSRGVGRDLDLGPLDDFVGFRLRLAQDVSFRAFARRVGDRRLKPGRLAALVIVDRNPGLTQKDLGRAVGRDKSSVTQLIQDLQREGLLDRRASEADRRSRVLTLTRKGKTAAKALLKRATEHERELDALLGDQRSDLVTVLRKIVASLE